MLRAARELYLPLEPLSTPTHALLDLTVLGDVLIRCLMAKPWPEELKTFLGKQAIGRFSVEKVQTLKVAWASWNDSKYGDGSFAEVAGLKPLEKSEDKPVVFVDLAKRGTEPGISEEEALEVRRFQRGDEVTTIRRMTWSIPRAGQDPWRTDVPAGTPGTVMGYPDVKNRKVLLQVLMTVGGASCPSEVAYEV